MQITKDRIVSIDYTLTAPNGQVLDTSDGKGPLSYLHGKGNIIPGLEQALEGKASNDHINVTVQPEQAYGKRDEALVQPVPRDRFPGAQDIKPGMQFQAQSPQGMRVVTVVGVDDKNVTVDANHPLAGIPLTFDVTVREVRDATPEELSHGHSHAAGGHEH